VPNTTRQYTAPRNFPTGSGDGANLADQEAGQGSDGGGQQVEDRVTAEVFADVSRGKIKAASFDLNGLWSPWYTLHKTYAGLRDAYRHTGNKTALDVEIKFAEWADRLIAPMSDADVQRMLATEFGGMNEIFSDLYADTGDKRWLELSYKFGRY
jgi:DUF1680 family protein